MNPKTIFEEEVVYLYPHVFLPVYVCEILHDGRRVAIAHDVTEASAERKARDLLNSKEMKAY